MLKTIEKWVECCRSLK